MAVPPDIARYPWAYLPGRAWTAADFRADVLAWLADVARALPLRAWRVDEDRRGIRDLDLDHPINARPLLRFALIRNDDAVIEFGQEFDLEARRSSARRIELLDAALATVVDVHRATPGPVEVPVPAPGPGLSGSQALQAAMDSAPEGARLLLPPGGVYALGAEVYMRSGQTLVGAPGAVIRRAPFRVRVDGTEGCAFEGVTFDVAAASNFDEIVRGSNVRGITFRRCRWVNSGVFDPEWTIHAALLNDAISDVLIEDCVVAEAQFNIGRFDATGVTIRRCVFDRPMQYGLSFVTAGTGTLSSLLVEDCTCRRMATSGFIYVGDDVDVSTPNIVSHVNDVVLRRLRVDRILADGGVSRQFNLRPHNAARWLVEDIEAYNLDAIAPNHFNVLLAPRRPDGVCSDLTFRRIFGQRVRYGSLSLSNGDGLLRVSGLTIEQIGGQVFDGVNASTVPALLAKYGV